MAAMICKVTVLHTNRFRSLVCLGCPWPGLAWLRSFTSSSASFSYQSSLHNSTPPPIRAPRVRNYIRYYMLQHKSISYVQFVHVHTNILCIYDSRRVFAVLSAPALLSADNSSMQGPNLWPGSTSRHEAVWDLTHVYGSLSALVHMSRRHDPAQPRNIHTCTSLVRLGCALLFLP